MLEDLRKLLTIYKGGGMISDYSLIGYHQQKELN